MAQRPQAHDRAAPEAPRVRPVGVFAAVVLMLQASPLWAHSVEHEVIRSEATVVTLRTGPDQPLAAADYRVYAPEGGPPFVTGVTDPNGSLSFRPDRPGTWRVIATDRSGHGASIRVDVDESEQAVRSAPPQRSRTAMLIAGIGYIVGAAGLFVLLKRRS